MSSSSDGISTMLLSSISVAALALKKPSIFLFDCCVLLLMKVLFLGGTSRREGREQGFNRDDRWTGGK